MTELELLRARLVALRRSALDRLVETDRLDGGMLRLVADAGAVLAVLDEEAAAALAPERDGRAVCWMTIRRSRLQCSATIGKARPRRSTRLLPSGLPGNCSPRECGGCDEVRMSPRFQCRAPARQGGRFR